jgi:hypothetical protein
MANYTKINTRLQLKFDTWTKWNSTTGKAFVPLKGEVCIAEIPENTTATGELIAEKAYLIKVGNGSTKFELLPWLSALAADVHEWAKLPYEKFTELLDKGTLTYNGKTYTGTSFATDAELKAVSSTLTEAIGDVNDRIDGLDLDTVNKDGNEITFIHTVGQTGGQLSATEKTIRSASTSQTGIVQLSSSVESGGETKAATEKAVKTAYDKGVNAYELAGQANSAAAAAQDTADDALELANTNAGEIAKIVGGKTTVPKADHAVNADKAAEADAATKATKDGSGNVITATYETIANVNDVKSRVSTLEEKIEYTMHFIGVDSSNTLTDGGSEVPTITGVENYTPAAGDVVMSGGHEFVYTIGGVWERLGQDSEFMLATYKITNDNVAKDAGIEQTKIAATLTGNTTLANDISDLNQAIGALERAVEDNKSGTDTYKSYATVTGDSGTTTAATINDSLAINGDKAKIEVAVTTDKVAISHKAPGAAATRSGDSTSTAAPAFGETFTAIDSVSTDATGHVIKVNTKTVTVPDIQPIIDPIESKIDTIKSFSKVDIIREDNKTHDILEADGVNDTLNVTGGAAISVTGTANTDTMTIAHSNVTRDDPAKASTPTSLNYEGTFTVVESVASNDQGHITAVQLKDYKLPVGYDDSGLNSRLSVIEPIVNNKTWKTNTLAVETDKTKFSSLSASDLTIGSTAIEYIIFDCGSSEENI